jgi:sugar-phosphatase
LVIARLGAAGIPLPRILVAAEDIQVGKPDPSGYRLAATQLGVDATDCAIFEDVEAGIRAGEAAGGQVIVITATHTHAVRTPHPAIPDFTALRAERVDGRLALRPAITRDT